MYLKNDSSPKPIYAILVNASDGSPITSGVAAYHIQGTTRSAGQGTLTHIANGRWAYVPTQAETNYDAFAIDFYHASAVGQGVLVEIVTANQGLAVITADTSAIKQKTDAYLDATISSRAPANTALSNTVWTDAKADFLDAAISSRLEASSYVAPDNASISAIKTQTDKFQFDSNNYVYAVGLGGGGGSVQVIVQPLAARVQSPTGDGGIVFCWQNAQLDASWTLENVDLSGDQLAVVLYLETRPDEMVAQYSEGDLTVTYDPGSSSTLVMLSVPDSRVPPPGNYRYLLWDLTLDQVLVSGYVVVRAAPNPT